MADFRSLSGGRTLISLPFLDSAGIAARDEEAREALLAFARAQARERNASLELREFAGPETADSVPETPRVDLRLTLPEERGEEALWKSLPGKVRNQARKAEREGLVANAARPEGDSDADWAGFYDVYAENMRWLGSPPHSRRFFDSVRRHFGARARCVVARDGDRPVAGLVALRYADIVWVPWASALAAERRRCPNHSIYWEALRWAEASGARAFDFGRSPIGSGTHKFKRGWGATELPLRWTREDRTGRHVAPTGLVDSKVFRSSARLWRRLPRPVCHHVGPLLRKRIAS